jgi:hypothetical protein
MNLNPLFEGHAAANTVAIKKGTLWIGAISTVLSFLVTLAISKGWVPEGLISQQLISEISGIIATIILGGGTVATIVSTEKVGFRRSEPEPADRMHVAGMPDKAKPGGSDSRGSFKTE